MGQLASAKGKYENAEAQLKFSEIRSPINGVVTERPLYAGETAPAGTPLITVMDISALLAKTHLPQDAGAAPESGPAATVTVDGSDQSFPGTVSLVSPGARSRKHDHRSLGQGPEQGGNAESGRAGAASRSRAKTAKNAIVVPKEAVLTSPAGQNGDGGGLRRCRAPA